MKLGHLSIAGGGGGGVPKTVIALLCISGRKFIDPHQPQNVNCIGAQLMSFWCA